MLPYPHMHPRITNTLKTLAEGLFLFAGTLIALMSIYMLFWRANFCTLMMQLNAAIPPGDIDNYLMRRLAQREICGLGDYALGIFGFMLATVIAQVAWHTLSRPSNAVPG